MMIEFSYFPSLLSLVTQYFVVFCILFYGVYLFWNSNSENRVDNVQNIVFLTAHPDDECMFFGPSIIGCRNNNISLLCFTTGNFEKKGSLRQREIIQSCALFNIPAHKVTVLDISTLPDDPVVKWDRDRVCNEILKYCKQHNINQIYTFDSYGVSGHCNHRELYHAVRILKQDQNELKDVRVYSLESVSVWRKYISILDLPLSFLTSDTMFVSSPAHVLTSQRAMYAHWSQFVWFRVLFILFSRYLIINTFKEITSNKDKKTYISSVCLHYSLCHNICHSKEMGHYIKLKILDMSMGETTVWKVMTNQIGEIIIWKEMTYSLVRKLFGK